MRTFPVLLLVLFLLIYLALSFGAYNGLVKIAGKKNRKTVSWIYWASTFILFSTFLFLYVYPFQPSQATNYTVYFYFNFVLLTDFVFKTPLTVSLMLHYALYMKERNLLLYSGLILSTGFSMLLIYGVLFGGQNVRMKKYELEFQNLPESFNGYRIIQISDIHLGSFFSSSRIIKTASKKIRGVNPDLLIFTGDLVNNFSSEIYGRENYFNTMTESTPSFSILGNHDYGDYTKWEDPENKKDNFNEILEAQKKMGFKLLLNEHVVLKSGSDSIFLAGVENWGHPPFSLYADLKKAMQNIPEDAFTMLLTHDPAHWNTIIKNRKDIDLSFSGHTHGLQWGIKPAGIPFSLVYQIRENWSGLYQSKYSKLIVSTGLGLVGVPWRIDMPPEINLIILKRGKID